MKNITKVGLSALAGALAITSVNAGEMTISGSMEASYTKGSGYVTTGNPLGMDKELSVTGSTELDNGTTVSYKQTITDAMAFNDSELVFGNVLGMATVAMTSTGSPISAIDDVTPTAFEEANALIGSIDDVNGMDGTYGIRVTMADVGELVLKSMVCTQLTLVQETLKRTTVHLELIQGGTSERW